MTCWRFNRSPGYVYVFSTSLISDCRGWRPGGQRSIDNTGTCTKSVVSNAVAEDSSIFYLRPSNSRGSFNDKGRLVDDSVINLLSRVDRKIPALQLEICQYGTPLWKSSRIATDRQNSEHLGSNDDDGLDTHSGYSEGERLNRAADLKSAYNLRPQPDPNSTIPNWCVTYISQKRTIPPSSRPHAHNIQRNIYPYGSADVYFLKSITHKLPRCVPRMRNRHQGPAIMKAIPYYLTEFLLTSLGSTSRERTE